jgi:hypothetical protein
MPVEIQDHLLMTEGGFGYEELQRAPADQVEKHLILIDEILAERKRQADKAKRDAEGRG